MQLKHLRNLLLSIQSIYLNSSYSHEINSQIRGKWLPSMLMIVALILWIVFNIMAIESYQFPPYLLLLMNLIMYFVMTTVASPCYSIESKPSSINMTNENRID